ncbi:MAG: ISAs1 family transposase, partial [Clostridia bacterium]|nr:ISAs1 family transposase [Clostridia bacterium]
MANISENGNLEKQSAFQKHFLSDLNDPRRTAKGNLLHGFGDILFLVISLAVCGILDWEGMELFGNRQLGWLRKFRPFENGIPSHDTINRVVSSINPEKFGECFINWINEISDISKGEVIAIDGKTVKGSACKAQSQSPIHIVSAYAAGNELCIGQIKTDQKSDEISAIPKLLDLIAVSGCTVTIDAMGCQRSIAEKIREKGAHYILAVKGNQGSLEQGIKDTVRFCSPADTDINEDFGHGRIEKRICQVYDNLGHIESKEKWKDLKSLVLIRTEVFDKTSGKQHSEERIYITRLSERASKLNKDIRLHWYVENKLHWNLDVIFGEDASRKRVANAAENFSIIEKVALAMIQSENTMKKNK